MNESNAQTRSQRNSWGEASNEARFVDDEKPSDMQSIEAAVRLMSDAPLDLPNRTEVLTALAAAVRTLQHEIDGASALATRIESQIATEHVKSAEGATLLSMSRRKGKHLIYALLREVGLALIAGRSLDPQLLKTLGGWVVHRLLDDYHPSSHTISNLRKALLHPSEKSNGGWSTKAQARCLISTLRGLQDALSKNKVVAQGYGLIASKVTIRTQKTSVEIFNHKYRRRIEDLIEFSTVDAIAAAGGHDTLASGALQAAGAELFQMSLHSDLTALLVCLEIITHLPSETALCIPIQCGDSPPAGALAWFDLDAGNYCQLLYHLLEKGAQPQAGTEHLYESASQVVTIPLPPSILRVLQQLKTQAKVEVNNLRDLLGPAGHHPRSAVVGNGGYRVTSRRLQESVPALLLQRGEHRWAVALATSSHFLITRGRRAYGCGRATRVQQVMNTAYRLLGWAPAILIVSDELVGSRVTPTSLAVKEALNYLGERANREVCTGSRDQIIRCINARAEWYSMLLALGLSLRKWVQYRIRADELIAGREVHFDDKNVHNVKSLGVPVSGIVSEATRGWVSVCQAALAQLRVLADDKSLALAELIEGQIANLSSTDCIFTIDAIGRCTPVGHGTWRQALPQNMRLLENFARHFWPLQLMDRGLEQVAIDLLMRHAFDGLPEGSIFNTKVPVLVKRRLRAAMEGVIADLGLVIPQLMKGAQGHDQN